MISQKTIEQVFQAAKIENVVGEFVSLKNAGSNLKGLSPFTEEKTPSFMVSPGKNIFKCFSSGIGGGPVKFLMEHKGMTFPEAIEWIADRENILVEKEEETPEQVNHRVAKEDIRKTMKSVVRFYQKQFKELPEDHPAKIEIFEKRKLTEEDVIEWEIGFAPVGHSLRDVMLEAGKIEEGKELFVINATSDVYQDRIIYPIKDGAGRPVGLAGRRLSDSKKYAKFLNPKSNILYHKPTALFGLDYAIKSIRKKNFVYWVEGYNDVISMHKFGAQNTVASCGTAITAESVKLIKRHCTQVVLVLDNDAEEGKKNAGLDAALKYVDLFLSHGFGVQLCLLPVGDDPDSVSRGEHAEEIQNDGFPAFLEDYTEDAVLFKARRLYKKGLPLPVLADRIHQVAEMVAVIPEEISRGMYTEQAAKAIGYKIGEFKKLVKAKAPESNEPESLQSKLKVPKGVDKDEILEWGFYGIIEGDKTGYYFRSGEDSFRAVSNFVITPLFHKKEEEENTRIIKIDNGRGQGEFMELPSKALISVDQFRTFLFDKGAYFFDGTKVDLDRINKRYLHQFPTAYELKTLGWQPEGFFAFHNASFNGKLEPYDEIGMVKHEGVYYYSPASSDIYKDLRKEDDFFENDRFLEYVEPEINFEQWAELMFQVYGEHAFAGVPFVLLSLFRDVHFKVDNNSPFLYAYGQSRSGKSKFAESISGVFFKEMPAFNLNSGTDFAFAARLARFRNCPIVFNEFDDAVVKDEWYQALKGAYDGEGRERGKGGSKKKTEIQKVNGSLILVGQYLSTKDDNSVLSRSIIRTFQIVRDRTDAQKDLFDKLKKHERKGLSGVLTPLMQKRPEVERRYYEEFNRYYKKMGRAVANRKKRYEERVLRNYAALGTFYSLFSEWFRLPWSVDEFDAWIREEIIYLSSQISSNDILSDFWTAVETLYMEGTIKEGVHFKIMQETAIRVTVDGQDQNIELDKPTPILYVRISNVQQLYARFKKHLGQHAIDKTSLLSYLKNREYFFGYVNSVKFQTDNQSITTSAFLFDYSDPAFEVTLQKDGETLPF
jgi:DNA primase